MTTEYGVMINNQLIKHKKYRDGDKPLTYTEQPSAEGFKAVYEWQDRSEDILQVWELVEDDSEYEEPEPTAEEVLAILTGEQE